MNDNYPYNATFANPFIASGGSREWDGNELIMKNEELRRKARMTPLDQCVTDVYRYTDKHVNLPRPQLGGNAVGAPFSINQFGSLNAKPYADDNVFPPKPEEVKPWEGYHNHQTTAQAPSVKPPVKNPADVFQYFGA